ncbi:MAG: FG-GAP repeat protein [Deltaproteobacteria bacterium]|nr:FG-GAP repeat protein [Deltaproteobacteria bacterium]
MLLAALAACIFIDDAEHAEFLATLGGEADADADSDSDSDSDSDTDTATDTGPEEAPCPAASPCTISSIGTGYWSGSYGAAFGSTVAAADLDDDGRAELLASAVSPSVELYAVAVTAGGVGEYRRLGDIDYARLDASPGYASTALSVVATGLAGSSLLLVGDATSGASGVAAGGAWLFDGFENGANLDAGFLAGEAVGDQAGAALAALTLESVESVALGAPGFDGACGTAYVGSWTVDGGAPGAVVGDLGTLWASGGWHKLVSDCVSSDPDARLGSAVALGDFDGNGVADLATSAPYREVSGQSRAGYVYILPDYAYTDSVPYIDNMVSSGTAVGLPGAIANDYFGASLVALDTDGNGDTDLAVGAYGVDDLGSNVGRVYVFLDLANASDYGEANDANDKFTGAQDEGALGERMAPAGASGAPGLAVSDTYGAWFLPGGEARLSATVDEVAGAQRFLLGALGSPLSLAGGDFDGDGVIDMAVGTPSDAGPDGEATGAGSAWVILLGQ